MINHFAIMEFQVFLVLVALSLSVSMLVSAYGIESSGEVYWKMNLGSNTNMPNVVKDALLETRTTAPFGNHANGAQAYAQRNRFYANGAQAYAKELSKVKVVNGYRYYRTITAQPLSEKKITPSFGNNAKGAQAANENQAKAAQGCNTKDSQLLADNSALFFLEKDLIHPTSSMKLLFLMGAQKAKFMPSEVVNSIPFSSSKLPEILKFFALKPASENAKIIAKTITLCESKSMQGEDKSCENSLQGMVNYAKSKLGKQIKAGSTEVYEETEQEYQIKSATKIYNDQNVVCHKMVYPYAVFYCHSLSKTDTYQVSLVNSTGKKVKAVAVCHKDTSQWSPEHISFQLLKVKPGSAHICHFLNPDTVIWVPK